MLFTKTSLAVMDLDAISARVEQQLREHRNKYIFQGILFIVCGILAAAMPSLAALNVALLIGIVLLITGTLQLIFTIKAKTHWWSLLSAGLSILCGVLILWKPLAAILAIITVMAAFLTIEGIFELLLAYQFRMVRNWGWMFFSGIVTLGLAAILWLGYPTIGIFYLGWVVAINFTLYGLSLLMLVWRAQFSVAALAIMLIALTLTTPATAQTQHKHAVGDMYTKVLNALESRGQLDSIEPKKHVSIKDMHIEHGQVFVTVTEEGASTTSVYDMLGNKIVGE